MTCISRPGKGAIHGAKPRNMYSEIRDRNRISPIQMNSGSEVSVQLVSDPKIVVAIASPGMRVEYIKVATRPTPSSASPIQTPMPSNRNIAPMIAAASSGP